MPLKIYHQTRLWLGRVLGGLLVHAPLALMALLALLSFALFKQAPSAPKNAPNEATSTVNDYFLQRFLATHFLPTGEAKSSIKGDAAQHSPVSKQLSIEGVSFIAQGKSASYQGHAQRGTVSDDSKRIVLSQAVVIDKKDTLPNRGQTSKNVHFESAQITVQLDPDHLEATAPVQITNSTSTTTAQSLSYDHANKATTLKGRVKMVIQ